MYRTDVNKATQTRDEKYVPQNVVDNWYKPFKSNGYAKIYIYLALTKLED